ncbi:MAG: primosomal protein N', partial [Rhodobiaceae bacterium]|nr:primosomal protein N' [Rhodobiaceae bacterium]
KSNNIDLIIGTQLVAKGHHFPFLTLVGVIDADFGLGVTDMRATEKTYQLLHQVSGRAGREKRQGEVILLTHMPEHPVLQAIVSGERDLFYEEEAIMRENQSLPPFTRMISLIISSRDKNKVTMASKKLLINSFPPKDITLLGPIEAPIARIRGRYRMRFLLKGPKNNKIQVFVKQWIAKIKIEHDVKITVDVDPYNFL